MSEPIPEPADSSQSQTSEAELELQPIANETASAPIIIVNSPPLLTDPHQPSPLENQISLKKDEAKNSLTLTHSKDSLHVKTHKQTVLILTIQIIILIVMAGTTATYGWFHNVPSAISAMFGDKSIEDYYQAIATYNFVGVSPEYPLPSFFSVMVEAGIWSLYGVLARSEYYLTQMIMRREDLRLLEIISKLIGDTAMGVAMAMAVVAFLRSTELMNLTLKTADIGAIGAISFILGFYHEDTRRLLGNFRSTISGKSAKEAKEDEG